MIRVIISSNSRIRDALVSLLSLEKKEENRHSMIYKKGEWILVYFERELGEDDIQWIIESYMPDRIYPLYFGYSLDYIHEIGDVIVPNVFLSYDASIQEKEITKDNRDTFIQGARFLEIFEEQKDYYVEDYGLSIGGIVVDKAPDILDDNLSTKTMLVYEGDVYIEESLSLYGDMRVEYDTLLILIGIIRGKENSRYPSTDAYILTAKNIITTIKLLEEG